MSAGKGTLHLVAFLSGSHSQASRTHLCLWHHSRAPDLRKPTLIPPHQLAQRLFIFLLRSGFIPGSCHSSVYSSCAGRGTSFGAGCTWHTGTHVLAVELRMVSPLTCIEYVIINLAARWAPSGHPCTDPSRSDRPFQIQPPFVASSRRFCQI